MKNLASCNSLVRQERIKKLKHHREKLQKAHEVLETRKSEIKKEYRESHKVNVEEPDACMMDGYSGYNVQIGVDTKTQLILHSFKTKICFNFSEKINILK